MFNCLVECHLSVIGRITNWIRICQKWHNSSNFSSYSSRHSENKWRLWSLPFGGRIRTLHKLHSYKTAVVSIPSFIPFDSSLELWLDNWAWFQTFAGANSVLLIRQPRFPHKPVQSHLQVAIQSRGTAVTAGGHENVLSMDKIIGYTKGQFDPIHCIVRERFKLWSDVCRKPGETIQDSVLANKTAQVFLTNQSRVTYKVLFNLVAQQSPPKDVNALSMDEIIGYTKGQFDPTHCIVRERLKFWSDVLRKTGETIQGLAAHIRPDAITCDFPASKDPLGGYANALHMFS